MKWLTALNTRLSRWAMYAAVAGLLGIVGVVVYGVVMRYVFNDSQAYVEQVALMLVITFGTPRYAVVTLLNLPFALAGRSRRKYSWLATGSPGWVMVKSQRSTCTSPVAVRAT